MRRTASGTALFAALLGAITVPARAEPDAASSKPAHEEKPPSEATKPTHESKPVAGKPSDTKPGSAKPGDAKPSDTKAEHDKKLAPETEAETKAVTTPPPEVEPAPPPPDVAKPEPLPDPKKWKQAPPTIPEPNPIVPPAPAVEFGAEAGVVYRPGSSDQISYSGGWVVGGYARVDIFKFLAARLQARVESSTVSFREGALGLPPGTVYHEDDMRRVYWNFALEPQWAPRERVLLWAGLAAGWGRSTVPPLHTTGAFTVALPTRSAVFIEFPFSLGARYEIIPRWLCVNATAAFGLATNQSGKLLEPYVTPDANGKIVTVGGYPDLSVSPGPSWAASASCCSFSDNQSCRYLWVAPVERATRFMTPEPLRF